ncbi:MAG: hypothetical protein KAJ19_25480 [Gammaproteobacteria bacterium]|nr:hypothetical protein [Gammaproteobacteria bacterium]
MGRPIEISTEEEIEAEHQRVLGMPLEQRRQEGAELRAELCAVLGAAESLALEISAVGHDYLGDVTNLWQRTLGMEPYIRSGPSPSVAETTQAIEKIEAEVRAKLVELLGLSARPPE